MYNACRNDRHRDDPSCVLVSILFQLLVVPELRVIELFVLVLFCGHVFMLDVFPLSLLMTG